MLQKTMCVFQIEDGLLAVSHLKVLFLYWSKAPTYTQTIPKIDRFSTTFLIETDTFKKTYDVIHSNVSLDGNEASTSGHCGCKT